MNRQELDDLHYVASRIFDDDKIVMAELNLLLGLCLRDSFIDKEEIAFLAEIFAKISKEQVTDRVWQRILEIRETYGI